MGIKKVRSHFFVIGLSAYNKVIIIQLFSLLSVDEEEEPCEIV